MKRKMSTALIFAIVLVLITGVALAMMSLRDTGAKVLEIEQTEGYYPQWSMEQKTELVRSLAEQKYIEEADQIKALLAGELSGDAAVSVADAAMIEFTGQEVSEISFIGIMEAVWGGFETWSSEEQAWYSQLMVDMNIEQVGHTQYVMPEGPIDEAEAIAIAKREITLAFGVVENAMDGYPVTTSFQIPEFAEAGDTQAYWHVEIDKPEDLPADERFTTGIVSVFIHPETGELLEPLTQTVEYHQQGLQNEDVSKLQHNMARDFDASYSNYEEVYAFAQRWKEQLPQIRYGASLEETEYYRPTFLKLMSQVIEEIGLPQEGDITAQEAQEKARKAVAALPDWSRERIDQFVVCGEVYLTPADVGKPVYQFVFWNARRTYANNDVAAEKAFDAYKEALGADFGGWQNVPRCISVRIDAATGEVIGTPEVVPPGNSYKDRDEHDVLVN